VAGRQGAGRANLGGEVSEGVIEAGQPLCRDGHASTGRARVVYFQTLDAFGLGGP